MKHKPKGCPFGYSLTWDLIKKMERGKSLDEWKM